MPQEVDMKKDKEKKVIFTFAISVVIAGLLFMTAFLNISSYKNNYYDVMAENNYSVVDSIVSKIEYGVKYGKDINYYYDIDTIFEEINKYCDIESYFIVNPSGELLYGQELDKNISDEIAELLESEEDYIAWRDGDSQIIITKINKDEETIAVAGISYTAVFENTSLISETYSFVGILSAGVLVLFFFLFFKIQHNFDVKKIMKMVIPVVIIMNVVFGIHAYFEYRDGYSQIAENTSKIFLNKMQDDIEQVISSGIYYDEMVDSESYFMEITASSDLVSKIELTKESKENSRQLIADEQGELRYLSLQISDSYVVGKMRELLIRIAVTTITSLMIAVEILIFIIDTLLNNMKRSREVVVRDPEKCAQTVGVVRGISFFFAAFRYMSVAFMAIVLAEIYKPVFIFGVEIPYEILMSIPLSAQIFISMITSYLSGTLITKFNWKPIALAGIAAMSVGTLCSSFASEPVTFILSQMVVGVGLGFAKTAIDVYAVMASSEKEMSAYTSASNASIMVGFSCSASIGSVIASIFGYQGAYVVMTAMGVVVFLIIFILAKNISGNAEEEDEITEADVKKFDFGFLRYILFIIVPYSFIMEYVDYFFPVYANAHEVSTDTIGYVMLFYGIITCYIGAPLCSKFPSGKKASRTMSALLLAIGVLLAVFSASDILILASLVVLLIGFSDGVMPSMQFDYLYNLPFSKRKGFSKALGVEGFFSSAIGALAPIAFGVVMMYGNGGLMIVSGFILAAGVLFYVFDKTRKEKDA